MEHEASDVAAAVFVRFRPGRPWHLVIPVPVYFQGEVQYQKLQTLCGTYVSYVQYEKTEERQLQRPSDSICKLCLRQEQAILDEQGWTKMGE